MKHIIHEIIKHYESESMKMKKWMSENEDVKGSLAYETALLSVRCNELWIEIWSAFL
jgi:hypothetical protein